MGGGVENLGKDVATSIGGVYSKIDDNLSIVGNSLSPEEEEATTRDVTTTDTQAQYILPEEGIQQQTQYRNVSDTAGFTSGVKRTSQERDKATKGTSRLVIPLTESKSTVGAL